VNAGLDAVRAHPWVTAGAALGVMVLTVALGLVLRRVTRRLSTLRTQLLVITTSGVVVGGLVAWLLAALMIVEADEVGPIIFVLVVTALVGSLIVEVATSGLGSSARRLAATRPDLVALDCMSYSPATKAAVKAVLNVPTLLAITATGRVLRELLD